MRISSITLPRFFLDRAQGSVFENAAADEFSYDGILRDVVRCERRELLHDVHEDIQIMRAHEFRCQLLGELRDLAQIFCQDARLIVVEGVDVNGRVLFVGRNVLHLALVDRLRARSVRPRER